MFDTTLPSNLFDELDNNKGAHARNALLKAGICLFAAKGIEGTSTRELAKLAKQNISAINYYFDSKEGLYLACVKTLSQFVSRHFSPILARCELFLDNTNGVTAQKFTHHLIDDQIQRSVKGFIEEILFQFLNLATQKTTLNLSRIIFTEQLNPTIAYSIFHQAIFAPIHTILFKLIKTLPNLNWNDETIILHVHSLIGSVAIFRLGQTTLFVQTQWKEYTESEINKIKHMLSEQINCLLMANIINTSKVTIP